jgi:hypothetical protein
VYSVSRQVLRKQEVISGAVRLGARQASSQPAQLASEHVKEAVDCSSHSLAYKLQSVGAVQLVLPQRQCSRVVTGGDWAEYRSKFLSLSILARANISRSIRDRSRPGGSIYKYTCKGKALDMLNIDRSSHFIYIIFITSLIEWGRFVMATATVVAVCGQLRIRGGAR